MNQNWSQLRVAQRKYAELKQALNAGNVKLIESLLEEGAPVNCHSNVQDVRTPLHYSVHLGCPDIVKKLLDRGASVNVKDLHKETALTLAARFGKNSLVDLLLVSDRLENHRNAKHFSHLHIACMRNQVAIVTKLIQSSADLHKCVDRQSDFYPGFTPLHFAVQFQSLETVKLLLKLGADVTIKNAKNLTPLHLADIIRDEKMIDLLLLAHENLSCNPTNSEGLSHFHIACTRNNPKIVASFLRNGAYLSPGQSKYKPIHHHDEYSNPIDLAIFYECVDVVRLLLVHGFGVSDFKKGYDDRVNNAYGTGNEELINLISSRDKVTKRVLIEKRAMTQLHISVIRNDINILKELSSDEIDSSLNSLNWQGSTALHLAIECFNDEATKYLLTKGANCEIKNANGKTALHLAFDRKSDRIVDLILFNYSNYGENPVDNEGLSHLHIACAREHMAVEEYCPDLGRKGLLCKQKTVVVERFIKQGVDVNAKVNFDNDSWPGFTPLHLATKYQSYKLVVMLLENHACYSIVDGFGHTAFDLAIKNTSKRSLRYDAFRIMFTILSRSFKNNDKSLNSRGFSPLHVCGFNSEPNEFSMEYFIKQPSDIHQAIPASNTPWDGYTPLHFAMAFGDVDNANQLIKMGANIFAKADNGDTPVHLAFYWGEARTNEPLLNLRGLVGCGQNSVGSEGYSLFHVACIQGCIESIKYFLDIGVDANLPIKVQGCDINDGTPLYLIAMHYRGTSADEIIKLLVENGADVNARDSVMKTPLHYITIRSPTAIINELVSHGAEINALDLTDETPLLSIFLQPFYLDSDDKRLHNEIISSLLDNGADINLANNLEKYPLREVCDGFWHRIYMSSVNTLLKHVIRLVVVDNHVSETNRKTFDEVVRSLDDKFDTKMFESFIKKCKKEVKLMKRTRTNKFTTLHDIMSKNLDELAAISENKKFQKLINANNFSKKFPVYGPMLVSRLRKGQARRPLLETYKKALNSLIGIPLPSECAEMISRFLDNEDLRNIITAKGKSPGNSRSRLP